MPTELTGPLKFYAVWEQEKITIEYWGPTDRNDGVEEVVKTVEVYLTDDFDAWWYDASDPLKTHVYDYNRDDDPDNDYLGYKVVGWWNEYYADRYDADIVKQYEDAGSPLKVQDIYDTMVGYGWDPSSNTLRLYAEVEVRNITVTFDWGGAPSGPEPVEFSWFDSPTDTAFANPGYKFTGWTDEGSAEILTPTADLTAPWSSPTGSYTTDFSDFNGLTAMRQVSQHDPFLGLGSYTAGDIVMMMAYLGYDIDFRLADKITINATWEYIGYDTIFDYLYNDEYGNPVSATVNGGFLIEPSFTNPTRPGYLFGGWYTNADGSGIRLLSDGTLDLASVGMQFDPNLSPYNKMVADDTVLSQTVYAYWIKEIPGSSTTGTTMGGTSNPVITTPGGSMSGHSDGTAPVILEGMADSEARLIDDGETNSTIAVTADEKKTLEQPIQTLAAKTASFADVAEPATDTGKLGCRAKSEDVTGQATVSSVQTEAPGSTIDGLQFSATPAVLAVTEDERRRNAA